MRNGGLSDTGDAPRYRSLGKWPSNHVASPRTSAALVSAFYHPVPLSRSSIPQAALRVTTMLSTLRRSSLYVAKRRALARAAASSTPKRTLVQPSGADRASVVDVPSTYQDDNLFGPRPGGSTHARYSRARLTGSPFSDMLGFKLELSRREETLKSKARPIYLDMQVRESLTKLNLF